VFRDEWVCEKHSEIQVHLHSLPIRLDLHKDKDEGFFCGFMATIAASFGRGQGEVQFADGD
jgi:hypothetical protein